MSHALIEYVPRTYTIEMQYEDIFFKKYGIVREAKSFVKWVVSEQNTSQVLINQLFKKREKEDRLPKFSNRANGKGTKKEIG